MPRSSVHAAWPARCSAAWMPPSGPRAGPGRGRRGARVGDGRRAGAIRKIVVDEADEHVELSIEDGAAADRRRPLSAPPQPPWRGRRRGSPPRTCAGEGRRRHRRIGKAAGGESRGTATVSRGTLPEMSEPRIGRLVVASLHQAIAGAAAAAAGVLRELAQAARPARKGSTSAWRRSRPRSASCGTRTSALYDSITSAGRRAGRRLDARRRCAGQAALVARCCRTGCARASALRAARRIVPRRLPEHAVRSGSPREARSRSRGRCSARCASPSTAAVQLLRRGARAAC